MNLAQELERLAQLHAQGALTEEEFTKAKSQLLSSQRSSALPLKGIRRESTRKLCGLPLWAIAMGPDWERGEMRGHARGIFALGGLAIGLVAIGGGAIGVLVALGGGAIGGIAFGGGAVGGIAVGGGACGYYAFGGGAVGVHTVSALQQDPAALDFFQHYFPWLMKLLHR